MSKAPVEVPDVKEFLKAGVQFGHEIKRWNPKMRDYIYGEKNNIHVIDISKTLPLLDNALKFITESARKGPVLFVGTKRQATDIVREEAIRCGAFFIDHRWPGGLLTNFEIIKRSLNTLQKLEKDFEEGVHGRTKYEVAKMKVKWERLARLYKGIKTMTRYPSCVVVVDARYEMGAIREAKRLKIPVISIVDTNSDPTIVDYVVPGNDDAIRSIKLFMKLFADAVLVGNGGHGIKHNLKDYSKVEVKLIKEEEKNQEESKDKKLPKIRIKKRVEIEDKKSENNEKELKIRIKSNEKFKKKEEVNTKISSRVKNALDELGISVADAQKMKKEELVDLKGIGEAAADEILGK